MHMPNGKTMVATHTALIPLPQPPLAAQKCDVFPELQQPLLSLGQFCDAGFTATLTIETFLLTNDDSTKLTGTIYHNNGLYSIPLKGYPNATPPPPTPYQPDAAVQAYVFANSAYHMITLPALVQFLHRSCFSPVIDTWCKAIDAGYFTTWPGLTSKLVRKHLPAYIETAKGHLRLTRQHVQSTRDQTTRTPPP